MGKTHLNFTPVNYSDQLSKIEIDEIQENTYHVFEIEKNNLILPIPGLLYLEKKSEFLTVLFNGALNREKTGYLTFQRWSWIERIGTNVLIFPPTLTGGLDWGTGISSSGRSWPCLRR